VNHNADLAQEKDGVTELELDRANQLPELVDLRGHSGLKRQVPVLLAKKWAAGVVPAAQPVLGDHRFFSGGDSKRC
jgi:hypothetical protein